LAGLGFLGASALLNNSALAQAVKPSAAAVKYVVSDPDRPITKEDLAISYNNYCEFSLDKKDVKKEAANWKRPEKWKISISGLVEKPFELDLTDFMKLVA
jgi:DMSO/TMAO reductase YedYZ molybdopterin-dependent catalytic subunit